MNLLMTRSTMVCTSILILVLFGHAMSICQVVDFNVDQSSGCAGYSARFQDLSTSPSDPIVSWRWNLGGPISTLQNPRRTFIEPGTYEICLEITTQSGQNTQACKPNYIVVFDLPKADFIADQTVGCNPLSVQYQDQSTIATSPITSWSWNLGGSPDAINSNNSSVPIRSTYNQSGLYSIELAIVDENGCTSSIQKDNYIEVLPSMEMDIDVDFNFGCNLPHEVNFTNLSSNDPDIRYTWDFGNQSSFNGFEPGPIFYNVNGFYDVTLIAQNLLTSCQDTLFLPQYIQVGGEPIDFTISELSGCPPFTTNVALEVFQSTDSVVWNFGDGHIKTGFNVVHTYTDPGCYTISLIKYGSDCEFGGQSDTCIQVFPELQYNAEIQNPEGCLLPHIATLNVTSTQEVEVEWYVNDLLVSTDLNHNIEITSFGSHPVRLEIINEYGCAESIALGNIQIDSLSLSLTNRPRGCTPLSRQLDYQSNSISSMSSWQWDVYDSNNVIFSSSLENPTINIVDIGNYDVRLIASNTAGCIDTVFNTAWIQVGNLPDVRFTADLVRSCLEDTITFTDLSSIANEWLWDFGDGTSSREQHPRKKYDTPGLYTVILSAALNGCQNTESINNYIEILEPISEFTPIYNCSNPFVIEFQNTSIGADSIHWDFGFTGGYDPRLDTTYSPIFDFQTNGKYQVALTVFNFTTGCKHTSEIEINTAGPVANFSIDKTQGCAPLEIGITDLSENAVEWYYYLDGNLINTDNNQSEPEIEIVNSGAYTDMRLIVLDENTCRDTFDLPVDLMVSEITPGFVSLPNPGCVGDNIVFKDTSISLFSPIESRNWIIDGITDTLHADNFTQVFNERGVRDVELMITNTWGCTNTVTQQIELSKPSLDFRYDTLTCSNRDVQIINLSAGSSLTYEWDFGDSNTSTLNAPIHQYTDEGDFNICMTATDQWGCKADLCGPTISIKNPVALFIGDTLIKNCPPLNVNFENKSTNYINSTWNFGDGSSMSMEDSPTHSYSVTGQYDVELIVELTDQCKDTLIIEDYITLNGPVGTFNFHGDTICGPREIKFIASSNVDYIYTWDFGDGNIVSRPSLRNTDTIFHTYFEEGKYRPLLILSDATGCELIIEAEDQISVHNSYLDFFIAETELCQIPSSVQPFNFSYSTDPATVISWIINGPVTDTVYGVQPEIIFETPGRYSITLILENEYCTKSLEYAEEIQIGITPTANFTPANPSYCQNELATFSDRSTFDFGNITNRQWLLNNSPIGQGPTLEYTFDTPGDHKLDLEIYTDFGCSDIYSQLIHVAPAPIAEIEPYREVCLNSSTILNANIINSSIINSSSWYLGNTLICDNCNEININPTQNQEYTFVLQSNESCSISYGVEVVVLEVPAIDLGQDQTICKYEGTQISLSGSQPGDVINWLPANIEAECYGDCTGPSLNPLEDTRYFATVTNNLGCSSTDSVLVQVISDEADLMVADHVICERSSILLSSPSNELYDWRSSSSNCIGCTEINLSPDSSTTVYIETTGPLYCPLRDSTIVTVKPDHTVQAGDDMIICLGEMITLEAQGVGIGDVLWTSDQSIQDPTSTLLSIQPNKSSTYDLQVIEDLCTQSDSVSIIVEQSAFIRVTGDTICSGDTAWIHFDGLFDRLAWSTAPDIVADNYAGFILYEPIELSVEAFFRTCNTDLKNIELLVLPPVEIDIPANMEFYPDEELHINAKINYNGLFDIEWTPGELIPCNNCLSFDLSPESPMFLDLRVTDINSGCWDEAQIRLLERQSCDESYIFMPNVFTPNGDNVNDLLEIQSIYLEEIINFQIFNRWGEMIFETSDIAQGWDGTQNGQEQPIGIYLYNIETLCSANGKKYIKSGDFTLIR